MTEQNIAVGLRSRCWSLLTVGDDRQYGGNTGYDDDPTRVYPYDSKVPNCKRISPGDIVLVRNREYAFGIAVIKDINVQEGQKENLRCPSCQTTKIKPRKTKTPKWRCHLCKHTFSSPVSDFSKVTAYSANYGDTYIPLQPEVPFSVVKAATSRANDQMSMQPVDPLGIDWSSQQNLEEIEWILIRAEHRHYEVPINSFSQDEIEQDVMNLTRTRREKVLREISSRWGQSDFRKKLITRYSGRCCISGCGIAEALEAAHIRPYVMSNDNHPGNGLLLRADIHTLFDLDLIGIDPEELTVNVNPLLADSDYASFVGLRITTEKGKPSAAALKERWGMFIQRSQSGVMETA